MNPIVAILLGTALAGEEIHAITVVGAGVILAGILVLSLAHRRPAARVASEAKAAACAEAE